MSGGGPCAPNIRPPQRCPHVGEVLYTGSDGTGAVQVVRVEYPQVWYVPLYTNVRGGHQGNLYDADGNHPYRV